MNRSQALDLTKMYLDNRKLHNHQVEAIKSLNKYFRLSKNDGDEKKSGLLVMPTGSGKTFTAVNWLLEQATANGYKVIWLAHRQELIDQADYTFRRQSPILLNYGKNKCRILPISSAHYAISQASRYDIYVCSIGTAASKNGIRYLERMIGSKGKDKLVVVIDEAHHAVSPSYQKVLKQITKINPNRILLGLTATPTRMQESEKKRLNKMFEVEQNGYIYEVKLKDLLANGTLAYPIYKKIETKINGELEFDITFEDEDHFTKYGELSEKIKRQIATSTSRNQIIVDEYINNKNLYGKTLIFAVNQLHAITLTDEFKKRGISCEYCISSEKGSQDKIREFKEGKFDILINVQILTEGSDVPDINTVFLTRQTNSDSLLMQMIGRGLRGESAGGTKSVYIVDFHDTWDKFNFWLDPKHILENECGAVEDITEGLRNQEFEKEEVDLEIDRRYSLQEMWDIYQEVYNRIKFNYLRIGHKEVFPHGWYSIVNEYGENDKVLVFDNQLEGYNLIEENINEIIELKLDPQKIIKDYFDCEDNLPTVEDMYLILDNIYEFNGMPAYFTFEEREEIDSYKIASELLELNLRRKEENQYLIEKYESNNIIKEVYKTFDVFKRSITDAIEKIDNEEVNTEIIYIDEREQFNIIENYYNLNELLEEVINEVKINKWFEVTNIPEIRWSRKPLRSKFGTCTKHEDQTYTISVNKLLSSPKVPRDVVKYLIYHELMHACGYWNHGEIFRNQEWKYPNSTEHDSFLDKMFIDYNLDKIVPRRNNSTCI